MAEKNLCRADFAGLKRLSVPSGSIACTDSTVTESEEARGGKGFAWREIPKTEHDIRIAGIG